MVHLGLGQIASIFLGRTPVIRIYLGNVLVFGEAP